MPEVGPYADEESEEELRPVLGDVIDTFGELIVRLKIVRHLNILRGKCH